MTRTGIQCFLAICRHKTGCAAAQALYITQPSLSARLKLLEDTLGVPLFYRNKGSREMTLTPAGREFYPLALEYEALMEKMEHIGAPHPTQFRISSYNSLATYVLPAVYQLLLEEHPQFGLEIQDMELSSASRSILNGETDLAFTSGIVSDNRLLQIPAFSEPMVLVCAAESIFQEPVNLQELQLRNEVYVDWSNRFSQWHKRTLGTAHPQLCVSIMNHLQQFLMQEGRWAIVPVTVAAGLAREVPLKQLKTNFALPRREVSCVVEAQAPTPVMDIFFDCLRQVLGSYPEIEILL